jgi:hypothetical protein
MTWCRWQELLQAADVEMKKTRGHSYIHVLKTRCEHCGRSPKQRGECVRWLDTFLSHLWRLVSDEMAISSEKGPQ